MKKLAKMISLMLVILMTALLFVGCGGKKESTPEVVGVWSKENGYERTTVRITEDGNITLTASYMGKEYPFLEGTYTLEGNKMTVTYGELSETTEYSVSGNTLKLTLLKTDFTLTRQ